MEQLLIRTVGTCLQELTDLRNHVRELEAQVHTLSASSTASASTEPPGVSKRIGLGRDPRDASSLLHVCGVAHEPLRELMAPACVEGELHFELRDLVRRLREKGDAGAEEPTDFQEVLLAELRAGGISALALTWDRSEGESPKAIVDRSPEGCEAALARSLAAEGEAAEGEASEAAATVVLVPTFSRATWSLLQAALAFCRKERLTPSLELVHAAMRSLLTADAQFQDVDIIGMMRLAPEGKGATVHVRGGRVVVRAGEDAEGGATQVNWGTQPLPMMPTSLLAQLRHSVGTLQALGGGSKAAMECNLPWMLPVLRASDFAAQSSLPEAARTATGADLLQACAGATEWGGNTVSPGLPHPALAPKVSEVELWSQPLQPGEVEQGCQSLSRGSLPVVFGDTKSRHSLNSLPGLEKVTSNKSTKSAKSAKSAKSVKSRVSERDSADGDSDDESAGGLAPKEMTQKILAQQSAFLECFRAELFGQRPLLLSQLNNLYKMRSDQELPYKTAGYEKLREFLMDIPGLSLMGRGNRMQVRLADEAKLEAFMNQTLFPVAESQGSQAPQFSMPQPLPESLQYCLHQLFLNSPSHEIPLRNFLNEWNTHYPSQPLAYRALGFRDVRALLSQVAFIEKVGSKGEAKYVLKGQDGARGALQVVPTGLVSAQAAPPGAAGDSPLSESEAMPMPDTARTVSTRSDRGNSVGQQLASAPLSPQQQPVWTAPAMPSVGRTSSRAERFASNTSVGFAEEAGGYPSDLQAAPSRISSMGSRAEARLREMQQMDLSQAAGSASPSQPLMRQNPRRMDAGGPDELLVADQRQVSDPQREQQARHVLYRTSSGLSSGQLSPQQEAGEEEFYSAPMGLSRAVGELLRGGSGSSPTLSPTKAGINPRDIPPRLAPERMGGMANAYGSNGVRNAALHNLGPAFDTGPGLERSLLFMEPRAMQERKASLLPSALMDPGRMMTSGVPEAGLPEDDIMPLLTGSPSFPEPPPGIGEESFPPQQSRSSAAESEGMSSAQLRLEHRRMRAAKRAQGVRMSSAFLSSPGAFSSETRDATLHQGKFDMSSVLQMQLRGKEPPSLVCDIANLKVLHSNDECAKLFESSSGFLAQADILSFLGQEDHFKFSQVVAYMIVSNSSKMEPQEMTIVTNRGNQRNVRMEGVQLLGMWWQLDFIALDGIAAAGAITSY